MPIGTASGTGSNNVFILSNSPGRSTLAWSWRNGTRGGKGGHCCCLLASHLGGVNYWAAVVSVLGRQPPQSKAARPASKPELNRSSHCLARGTKLSALGNVTLYFLGFLPAHIPSESMASSRYFWLTGLRLQVLPFWKSTRSKSALIINWIYTAVYSSSHFLVSGTLEWSPVR